MWTWVSRVMFQRQDLFSLSHFKLIQTVKTFGWLPWNWRVKIMKIKEQGIAWIVTWTVCASVGSVNNMNKLSLVGMQLPEKYEENFDVSSEGPSYTRRPCQWKLVIDWINQSSLNSQFWTVLRPYSNGHPITKEETGVTYMGLNGPRSGWNSGHWVEHAAMMP
jgi:hypothetical protein